MRRDIINFLPLTNVQEKILVFPRKLKFAALKFEPNDQSGQHTFEATLDISNPTNRTVVYKLSKEKPTNGINLLDLPNDGMILQLKPAMSVKRKITVNGFLFHEFGGKHSREGHCIELLAALCKEGLGSADSVSISYAI